MLSPIYLEPPYLETQSNRNNALMDNYKTDKGAGDHDNVGLESQDESVVFSYRQTLEKKLTQK